ncbi:unnamed protein product [Urochloa humidicola]
MVLHRGARTCTGAIYSDRLASESHPPVPLISSYWSPARIFFSIMDLEIISKLPICRANPPSGLQQGRLPSIFLVAAF